MKHPSRFYITFICLLIFIECSLAAGIIEVKEKIFYFAIMIPCAFIIAYNYISAEFQARKK